MKKLLYFLILTVFLLTLTNSALAKKGLQKGDKLKITTSKTLLKNFPKPFGVKIVKTLQFGDIVIFIKEDGSWYNVEYESTKGFIPKQSLLKVKRFKSFSKTVNVTETDMVAATKGFGPEVEKKNRENRELRYDLMDKAEIDNTDKDPLNKLERFRKAGNLGEFQGDKEE